MSLDKRNESGVSVVELMIGAVLLALVIVIGSGVMSRLQKTARHDQNRMSSHKTIESIFTLIKRDAAVQIEAGLQPLTGAQGVQITRLPAQADDATVTYSARYQSTCQAFPADQVKILEQLYAASNRSKIYQDPHSCLKALNCQDGTWPVVTVLVQGPSPAAYPQKTFPGVALCSTPVTDQLRIVMESVYALAEREPLEAAIQQKVFLLPIKSADDLNILPN